MIDARGVTLRPWGSELLPNNRWADRYISGGTLYERLCDS